MEPNYAFFEGNPKTGEIKFEVEDYDVLDVVEEIQKAEEKLNRIRQRVGIKFPGVVPFLKADEIDVDFRCGICLDVFIRVSIVVFLINTIIYYYINFSRANRKPVLRLNHNYSAVTTMLIAVMKWTLDMSLIVDRSIFF